MKLCKYGCGQEGKFSFKNGELCCENSKNKCPINRKKNIRGKKENLKYRNCTDWKSDPRKEIKINEKRKDISWYYWNLYFPDDPIIHGDGYLIHHTNLNHNDNSKNNLQKMTINEHAFWHSKHTSKETRLKKSKAMKGKKQTGEQIKKAAEARKGKNNKPVIANFINYKSGKEAAESLGVCPQTIINRIRSNKPGYSYK